MNFGERILFHLGVSGGTGIIQGMSATAKVAKKIGIEPADSTPVTNMLLASTALLVGTTLGAAKIFSPFGLIDAFSLPDDADLETEANKRMERLKEDLGEDLD